MKKSTLFLACCVGLMLFASCKKDPVAPTISIFEGSEGEVCVTENAHVYSGDEITVGFMGQGEKLTKVVVVVSQDGTTLDSYSKNWENPVSEFDVTCSFSIEATGAVNIEGTVTDAAGQTASTSFNIYYDEKPNAKFVGHYEGDALFSGVATTPMPGNEQVPFENQAFPTLVDIVAGDEIDEVVATITINDQATSVKGVVDGDRVTFEAINATYNFTYVVTIPLEMTYNIIGTLNAGMLDLEGDCKGEGEVNIPPFIMGPVTLDGTIGGSLTKVE